MNKASPTQTWPAFYPEGVPPADATPTRGTAYRLVPAVPPSQADFRSTHEEFPERQYPDEHNFINSFGASFHMTLEASRICRRRYKGLRSHRIVVGTFASSMGCQKPTYGPGHLSVWLYVEAAPHREFTRDAEGTSVQ